jgi:4-alpha-glucanotransferase
VNRQLAALAGLYGIQTSYRDTRKQRQEAQPESVLLILAALGASVRTMDDVPKALAEEKLKAGEKSIPPVMVAWDGKLPAGSARFGKGIKAYVVDEDGHETSCPPRRLPPGYHRLIARNGRRTTETLIIAAPVKARFPFSEPVWGAFAPAYSLDSARALAAGDLTDFDSFTEWILAMGGRIAATLPLLAGYLDAPFDPSPYAPVSRLFWNEFYADPRRAWEFTAGAFSLQPSAAEPRNDGLIDYRRVMAQRRATLEKLARQFFTLAGSPRRNEFEAFCRSNPELDTYARFRAVVDRQRSGWKQWPARLRDGVIQNGDFDADAFDYHRYAQWIVQEQLQHTAKRMESAGGALYLDMPLGLHMSGYDTWRYPQLFVQGMAAGAPPDPVSTEGQHWGFQPLDPRAMRQDHYRYTIAGIRNHLKFARLIRIDHVMGLHRQYWIPDGVDKSQGVYVQYPADELYAIWNVESHRSGAGVVGEDLGTVPPEVRKAMGRHNIQRLYALQYEIVETPGQARLRPPPPASVACLNTHDMPPFRAFLDGRDIPDRIRLGFLDEEAAREELQHRSAQRRALTRFLRDNGRLQSPKASSIELFQACVEFIGSSRALAALINVEDLWQETDPQNVPATTAEERPNWRRRFKHALEEMRANPRFASILQDLDSARRKRMRQPPVQPRET